MGPEALDPNSFWLVAERLARFARVVAPGLLLAAGALWLMRKPSWQAVLALVGALMFGGSQLAHYLFPQVQGVYLGAMQPLPAENPVVFFLYMHGFWLGLLLFAAACLLRDLRDRGA